MTNNGTVSTTGADAHGLFGNGNNNTLINNGAINVSGINAHGMTALGATLGPIINTGSITASGFGGLGAFLETAATFTNAAGATIVSQQASGIIANGGGIFNNAGTITGQNIGINVNGGAGNVTNSGTITGITGAGLFFTGNFNNSVTNSGTINGNGPPVAGVPTVVQFGGGNDALTMLAGAINGRVDQGLGQDTFVMSGGQMQTLDQGGDRDTAVISGGRIVGTFTDGDDVTMTGGRIGLVNLVAGNNIMRMSGGTIDTNVTAEQGNDVLELSGGSIGGFVDLGNGNNSITITNGQIGGGVITGTGNDLFTINGGSVGGNVNLGDGTNTITVTAGQISGGVTTGTGNDTMTWSGGTIAGVIGLGAGNDVLTLRTLTNANLAGTTRVDGGLGNDRLTFDNSSASGVERFVNWELIELTNRSQLTFNSTLVLGDAGTGTGALTVDATSAILAGGTNSIIAPFTAGQLVTVTNAGTVDLTNAGAPATSSLMIVGNYIGAGGLLNVRTVVAGDGAPSDRLVISGGTGSGSTAIRVTNAGGTGAQTVTDGILLVQAVNGATTTPTAFSLASPISVGAYNYFLFRGGVSAGSQNSWFLRSALVAPPQPSPTPAPDTPVSPPTPAPGTPPLPPAPAPGEAPIPLFRPEVAVQAVVPIVARTLGLVTLGTFNERMGDQLLLRGDRNAGAWGRVFGQATREHFAQGTRPDFDGTFAGFQAGADVSRSETSYGHRDHLGFYLAHARAVGDVSGSVNGFQGAPAGRLELDASSFGAYWTHIGPSNWYVDTVLQGSIIQGFPRSVRDVANSVSGRAFAASVEVGVPIPLTPWLVLQPQAQGIWQRLWLDNTLDPFSTIAFDRSDAFTGRVGALLQATFGSAGAFWQPYLKGNVWWGSSGLDVVTFATDRIPTQRNGGAAVEGGGGITGKLTRSVSVYGDASYLGSVSGERRTTVKGNVGLRVTW